MIEYMEEYTNSITRSIVVQIMDTQEKACMEAITKWAKKNGIDDVFIIDESKLKRVLELGIAEYRRINGD